MTFTDGGMIIAFVGPQATGKSTLVRHLRSCLGRELAVKTLHAGKPPGTWLTWLPSRLIPLARKLRPGRTFTDEQIEAEVLPAFTRCAVETVATDRGLEETPDEVRRIVWGYL